MEEKVLQALRIGDVADDLGPPSLTHAARACLWRQLGRAAWVEQGGDWAGQCTVLFFIFFSYFLFLFPNSTLNSDLNSNIVPHYPHFML
jgi:hypothetical protein